MDARTEALPLSKRLIALFDFSDGQDGHLAFSKGDEFRLNSGQHNWWHVKHLQTLRKGLVPKNFVIRMSEEDLIGWCDFGLTRAEAKTELFNKKYCSGSFIIRSTSGRDYSEALALSVKTMSDDATEVHHYEIVRKNDRFGLSYEMDDDQLFPSLTKFVMHFSRRSNGFKQRLVYSVKKNLVIDAWEIDPSEIQRGKKLGSGHFGDVYQAKLNGRAVAIKTPDLATMTEEEFMKEAEIARPLSHENIVKTIGVCSLSEVPYIVTEFLEGKDLKQYVAIKALTNSDNLSIARKIACGMAFLEGIPIVHRDLAARNILVGKTHETIKLADFGLARCLDRAIYYKTINGLFPFKWTAPEAFVFCDERDEKPGRSSSASDVWSYAVVLWEVYSKGRRPYAHIVDPDTLYDTLTKDNYRLPCPNDCPETIYSLMLKCWSIKPSDRPSFAQILHELH